MALSIVHLLASTVFRSSWSRTRRRRTETFGSLYEWTLCVIALKREEKQSVAFLREQRGARLTGLQIRAHRTFVDAFEVRLLRCHSVEAE